MVACFCRGTLENSSQCKMTDLLGDNSVITPAGESTRDKKTNKRMVKVNPGGRDGCIPSSFS